MVIDASVWVSYLVPSDAHHAASYVWLTNYAATGRLLVEPVLLIVEVAGAISRRSGRPDLAHQAVQTLRRIPAMRFVPIDSQLGERAAQLAADLSLRGADAVYVALAHQLGLPLVTWDDEQRTRAAAIISVQTP
jgi:predicted nucleic acid-binding protein